MIAWITFGIAASLWGAVAYFLGGRFGLVHRSIERGRIDQDVHQMYDTPENITAFMNEAPNNPVPAIKWVYLAQEANDWPEVALRSRIIAEQFPKLFQGHFLLARALGITDELAESRQIIRRLYRKWPKDTALIELEISQLRHKGDWLKVERLSDRYRRNHFTLHEPYNLQIDALLRLNDFKGAERILFLADKEFPENEGFHKLWDRLEEQLAEANKDDVETITSGHST